MLHKAFRRAEMIQNIIYRSYCAGNDKSNIHPDVLHTKPEETIFQKIVKKEVPAQILYEDDKALCFKDINPIADVHVLVIPKKPISGMGALKEEDSGLVGHCLFIASKVARQLGIDKTGYRIVTNEGKHGQQSVNWLHFHVIGGRQLSWPPG